MRGCLGNHFTRHNDVPEKHPQLGFIGLGECVTKCSLPGWLITSSAPNQMHVKFSSDGNVSNNMATGVRHQGFSAVYSISSDPLMQIRKCMLGEVTLSYGDGSTRFCGVAGNSVGGARRARPSSRVTYVRIICELTAAAMLFVCRCAGRHKLRSRPGFHLRHNRLIQHLDEGDELRPRI